MAQGNHFVCGAEHQRGRQPQSIHRLSPRCNIYERRAEIRCARILRGGRKRRQYRRQLRQSVERPFCAGCHRNVELHGVISQGKQCGRGIQPYCGRPGWIHERRHRQFQGGSHRQRGARSPWQRPASIRRRALPEIWRDRRIFPQTRCGRAGKPTCIRGLRRRFQERWLRRQPR